MSALFPPASNTIFRVVALVLIATPVGALAGLLIYVTTPFFTGQNDPVEQLVQFDHRHHVSDDGIDCRYCHTTVERSATAGIPPTSLCLNCHAQIWNKSPLLDEVRGRYFSDRPLPWNRVHQLPDFVYFNHAIHVNKGVGCATCHGRVDQMAAIEQVAPLTMGWCLDCHRDPAKHLRPPEFVTRMNWVPSGDPDVLGRELMKANEVHTRTSCTTCHR
jgi:hypothetical protein